MTVNCSSICFEALPAAVVFWTTVSTPPRLVTASLLVLSCNFIVTIKPIIMRIAVPQEGRSWTVYINMRHIWWTSLNFADCNRNATVSKLFWVLHLGRILKCCSCMDKAICQMHDGTHQKLATAAGGRGCIGCCFDVRVHQIEHHSKIIWIWNCYCESICWNGTWNQLGCWQGGPGGIHSCSRCRYCLRECSKLSEFSEFFPTTLQVYVVACGCMPVLWPE